MPEPRHEDPASGTKSMVAQGVRGQQQSKGETEVEVEAEAKQKHQRQNPLLRWTTVTLPPPIFLIPLVLLGFYFLFSFPSPQTQSNCPPQTVSPPLQSSPRVPSVQEAAAMSSEQTFIAIKPDGVQRGLIGPILSRFENRGFKLVAIKLVTPGEAHLKAHYDDLKDKPFFAGLISYMSSGPICAMVWEGRDAVKTGRTILGATNPLASAPGTIRGDFAIDVGRNVCHGSDSVESAKKEIALWFKEGETVSYKASQFDWIYEKA